MEAHWFVAYVRSCQERTVARQLASMGIEYYIPVRKELRQWSDRKVLKERLLMPGTVFVRCTETERRSLFGTVSYLTRFLTDRPTRDVVVVPDWQLLNFRRFIDGSEVPVEMRLSGEFEPGDKVRVISGPLTGTECCVTSIKSRTYLYVSLGILGSATAEIGANQIEKIQ
ncbi:MAG: UpxY family transcription antiterminator [Bacteroidales bacterium]|nr:UpxY family transcription antiterminator [Bacteroidales bacterium]